MPSKKPSTPQRHKDQRQFLPARERSDLPKKWPITDGTSHVPKEIIKFLQETRSLHCLHAAYLICIELKVELFLAPLDFDYSTRKWQGAEEEEEEEEHRDGGYSKWVDGRYKSSVVPFVWRVGPIHIACTVCCRVF